MTLVQLDIDIDINMNDKEEIESFKDALSLFLSTHCSGFKSLTTRVVNIFENINADQISDTWDVLKPPKLDNS